MDLQGLDDFLERVEDITSEVQDIISGKYPIEKSLEKEKIQRIREEERKVKEEQKLRAGREGKGEKFDTYKRFCEFCFVEYDIDIQNCNRCGKETISNEQRREYLMQKVEELKAQRNQRTEKKARWENWKKTQAMLYRKTATNYKKWDYFVDDDEEEEKLDFVPPANDPNFRELERDIKERADKRAKDFEAAKLLRDQGNEFFKAGKFRNAIKKYEEAQQLKKDWMLIYTNLAIAYIRIEDYESAIKNCERVLEYCEVFEDGFQKSADTCFKALCRRAMAYRGQGNLQQAINSLEQALDLKDDRDAQALLQRCKEEFSVSGNSVEASSVFELLEDADAIIAQLQTREQIQEFIQNNGYQQLLKQICEMKDLEALKVLKYLCSNFEQYALLAPIAQPLYDRRRTGALSLLLSVEDNQDDVQWIKEILELLSVVIENKEIRDEIVMHSGSTKGRKFNKVIMTFYLRLIGKDLGEGEIDVLKLIYPIMANLCLSNYKTAVTADPNPGSFKDITRYNWQQVGEGILKSIVSGVETETLGYLCNISTEEAIKREVLANTTLQSIISQIMLTSTNSLQIERGLGILVNLTTNPPKPTEDLLDLAYLVAARVFTFTKTTEIILMRGYLLLARVVMQSINVKNHIHQNQDIVDAVIRGLQDQRVITHCIKVSAACAKNKQFAEKLPLDTILNLALTSFSEFLGGSETDEKCGNIAMLISQICDTLPASQPLFKPLIEPLLVIVKEKLGPVRKNAAVCVAKIGQHPQNREELRRLHGVEILHSLSQFLV